MTQRHRPTTFPCPVCHGHGGETDVVFDGQGPYYPCDWCNDTGFITIGSDEHLRYFFASDGWYRLIFKFAPSGRALFDDEKVMLEEIEQSLRALWASLREDCCTYDFDYETATYVHEESCRRRESKQ